MGKMDAIIYGRTRFAFFPLGFSQEDCVKLALAPSTTLYPESIEEMKIFVPNLDYCTEHVPSTWTLTSFLMTYS